VADGATDARGIGIVSGSSRRAAVRAAYSTLLRLVVPLYALRILWRGRREPLYASAIGERFGLYRRTARQGAIWIHAVSLGETRAAAALIDALRAAIPEVRILLTHGTATGRAAGAPLLREGDAQAWLPFDTPGGARRFLRHFAPRAGILMETEIWPNVLAAARARGLPMLLVNARLSERSRRRGARVDALLRPAFEGLAKALAQSDADATRLRDAGVASVGTVGNLKFDLAPDPALQALGKRWKARVARPIVLAASTREGEEALLLAAWHGVPLPRPLLVIVPRHPQRFEAVAEVVTSAGFSLARRSAWDELPPAEAAHADVLLGDSMMEMPAYYALADVALLGGSFLPFGGQNLIEAAACGCPVVMGPHTFNFSAAATLSLAAGASLRVAGIAEAIAAVLALLGGDELARRGAAALSFTASHRGAATRSAAHIVAALDAGKGSAAAD
jgi:3-deoxy-D-manno-octulosonic-acid transferase